MASRSLGTLTLDLIARIGGFQQSMDQAARVTQRSMTQVERQVQSTSQNVVSSLKGIAAGVTAYLSIEKAVDLSQTWIGVQNRVKQVSATYAEFETQSKSVFQIAQNSQSGLDATAELYQRIASNSGQLGATQEKVAQVTQNISKSMSASGVSAEAAQGALVQLGQAFASGVLRGQELNSVLEQAPGLATAIADGMGIAKESLRAMGAEGKLTSKEVFNAILSQTQAIDDAFARSQTTLSGGWTVIENSASKIFGSLDETLNLTKNTVQAMLDLGTAMDSLDIRAMIDILEVGLYVALARVAAGFINSAAAKYLDIKATQEQTYQNSLAATSEVRRAEMVKIGTLADVEAARAAVTASLARSTAAAQFQAAEVARLRVRQESIAAELIQEEQWARRQISETALQQSMARTNALRLEQIALAEKLIIEEAKLASVTVAGQAEANALIAQRTLLTEALAVATTTATGAQIASTAAMGSWFAASTALGAGLQTLKTAGAWILRMAAGWPGIILTLGVLAYSFIDFGSKAETGANTAASAFEDASTRIRKASRAMLPEDISTQSYEQLQTRLKSLQADLKTAQELQERFQKGVDSKSDVPMDTPLADTKENIESLKLSITSVQKELASVRLASSKDGDTYLKNLEKQAVVAGKLTEVEKLRAQIAAGSLKFTPDDEKKALAAAAAIDKANTAIKASKASAKDEKALSKRFEEMEEGYQRQIELINTTTDKRKNATEVEKLAFEVSSGKLEGVNAQQQKRLKGLAAELDSLKAIKQAEEDAKKLAAFRSSLNEDYQTVKFGYEQELAGAGMGDKYRERLQERLQIEQDFNRQQRELVLQRNSGDISQDLFDKETKLLSDALAQRQDLQGRYYKAVDAAQADWGAGISNAWQNYADKAKDVAGQMESAFTSLFDGLTNAAVEWAFGADVTFGDVAVSFAKMLAQMALQAAASSVYSSVFGSFLSAGASGLAGGVSAGTTASSGMDYSLGSSSAGMTYTPPQFSDGGFTGYGGKYDEAGVVHGGEFVLRREVVGQPGMRDYLERLNATGKGYANGGYVGQSAAAAAATTEAQTAGVGVGASGGVKVEITINGNGNTQVSSDNSGLQAFGEEIGRFVETKYKQLEARSLAPQGNIRKAIMGRG